MPAALPVLSTGLGTGASDVAVTDDVVCEKLGIDVVEVARVDGGVAIEFFVFVDVHCDEVLVGEDVDEIVVEDGGSILK